MRSVQAVRFNPDVIRKVIVESGLTQVEIARAIGVTPQLVNQWAAGRKTPGLRLIGRFCAFFRLSPVALWPGIEKFLP